MKMNFVSKANQGAMFILYPNGDLGTQLAVANLATSYTVEFTEDMAKNGASYVVRTQDIHGNAGWGKTDDMDGFTVSVDLYADYNEDVPMSWFTYNGKSTGISYNKHTCLRSVYFQFSNIKAKTCFRRVCYGKVNLLSLVSAFYRQIYISVCSIIST